MKMTELFLFLLNQSMTAGWLVLAVMILRFILKKAPRTLICVFWGLIAIRLICPFTLKSPLSLIPSTEVLSLYNVQFAQEPAVNSGIPALNDLVNPMIGKTFTPAPGASVNPLYLWVSLAGLIWAAGLVCLLAHALYSLWRLHRRVREAVPLQEPVWICDAVRSPFILGLLRPRIYLPSDLDAETMHYVLSHEQAHLRRRDHWWKALGYLLLSVYWFHPLLWAAYALFCQDLELACDETVIRKMDLAEKKAYSHALLSCSTGRHMLLACPPAFSEGHIRTRVKRILHYRKPAVWLVAAALLLCIAAAVCLLTDPVPEQTRETPRADAPALSDSEEPLPEHETELPKTAAPASLEDAVSDAVLAHNLPASSEHYDLACCDFVMLEQTFSTPASGEEPHMVTCYGWALYQEYRISDTGINNVGGSYLPVSLTFEIRDSSYHLTEYWTPGEGSYFVKDVRAHFPAHIAEDGLDSQKYILSQMQSCYRQAVEESGMDPAPVLLHLLETIASSPAASSDPQDYLEAHPMEYRELLHYGADTLRYCFGRFRQGTETGLEGKIMALVCEELLQTKGSIPADAASSPTGQFWYDTLYAHAGDLVKPYLPASGSSGTEEMQETE